MHILSTNATQYIFHLDGCEKITNCMTVYYCIHVHYIIIRYYDK